MYQLNELLGKNVLFDALGRRLTGRVRIPAVDHDYLVVTPTGRTTSELVHVSDVISIIA